MGALRKYQAQVGGAGNWIGKIGEQSSDPQSSCEPANWKYYDDQGSDIIPVSYSKKIFIL